MRGKRRYEHARLSGWNRTRRSNMTNDEAQEAAKEWAGEAGGKLCPQLTENELAGIVNDAIAMEAEKYSATEGPK